jgi:hypothetical protein
MARARPAFRLTQQPAKTAPSRYGRRGRRRETKPPPNERLGSNWRARSLFQGRPLLAPAKLGHATVRVTKPYSAPNFSTRKPRQRNSDFHRIRFTRSTVSMLASTPSSTIRRVSSAMPAAKPANGAPPNSTAPS